MSKIIKNGQIVDDAWQVLTLAEGETAESVALPAAPALLPLSVWLARRDETDAPTQCPPGSSAQAQFDHGLSTVFPRLAACHRVAL